MSNSSRRERRRSHIKEIFIDAAVECIRRDGVERIKAASVADQAGYAVGTLYNYFDDLQELLYESSKVFFAECAQRLRRHASRYQAPLERLIEPALEYLRYFLENPDLFHLLFIKDLGAKGMQEFRRGVYIPEVLQLQQRSLRDCVSDGIIAEEEIETVGALVSNTVHGNLLFALTGRSALSAEELIGKTRKELSYLFH